MKNASNELISTSAERTDFYVLASVKFADGTAKELSRSDFYLSGNSYTDAAGSSSFPALNLQCTAVWIWTAERQKRFCSARSRLSSRNPTAVLSK